MASSFAEATARQARSNRTTPRRCWEWKFATANPSLWRIGHELIVISRRGDRSPARPNPLGLHPVTVREIDGTRIKIGPIEAFDGTPVVDIKSASTRADN